MYTAAIVALNSELARLHDDRKQTAKLVKSLRKVESYGYDRSTLINGYLDDLTFIAQQIKEINAAIKLLS